MPGRHPHGAWIHDRAERIEKETKKQYGRKKGRSVAFALATQQAEAMGKEPKGYGTPEGKADAKAKHEEPSKMKKSAHEALKIAGLFSRRKKPAPFTSALVDKHLPKKRFGWVHNDPEMKELVHYELEGHQQAGRKLTPGFIKGNYLRDRTKTAGLFSRRKKKQPGGQVAYDEWASWMNRPANIRKFNRLQKSYAKKRYGKPLGSLNARQMDKAFLSAMNGMGKTPMDFEKVSWAAFVDESYKIAAEGGLGKLGGWGPGTALVSSTSRKKKVWDAIKARAARDPVFRLKVLGKIRRKQATGT